MAEKRWFADGVIPDSEIKPFFLAFNGSAVLSAHHPLFV
jgi:hypothetical protein